MDPRETILKSPMSNWQMLIVAITVLLNALDGFDVLAISLASTLIAGEYGIDRAALGIVLSMELIGMAIGSIFLGGVADRFGRRPTMLGCLIVMSTGMFMATTQPSIIAPAFQSLAQSVGLMTDTPTGIVHISLWRLFTGLGIGGMLAAVNAVVAEYSSSRRKHMCVALMSIGYPLGAGFGSLFSSYLIGDGAWRNVFYLGFGVTLALLPVVFFLVPETIAWTLKHRPTNALEKVNATLARLGHKRVDSLPEKTQEEHGHSLFDIFSPMLIATTVIVTVAYFFHILTFYFVIKWVPDIVVRMGFEPSSAARILMWVSFGGASGGALLGFLTLKFNLKALTIGSMVLSTVMVIVFGRSPADLGALALICFGAGFFTNAAINGMYAIFAHAFPTHVRALGTGFAIGVGRGGSVLAPIIAGFLFEGGIGVPTVAMIMGLGSICAGGALWFLKLRAEPPEAVEAESAATAPVELRESAA